MKMNGGGLKDGQKEFVKQHNLQMEYMLVFRHKGDMKFDLLIFYSINQNEKEYKENVESKRNLNLKVEVL